VKTRHLIRATSEKNDLKHVLTVYAFHPQ